MLLSRILRRVMIRLVARIRRRAPVLVILMVLTAAAALVLPILVGGLPGATSPGMASGGDGERGALEREPPATATYLRGLELADARLMWDTFSEQARQELQQAGGSVAGTQRQLDAARETGVQIIGVQYAGSARIPRGRIAFYVVARTSPGGDEVAYLPYTFTLNANGQIDRVQ